MDDLMLYDNDTALWYALVNEAQHNSQIHLSGHLAHYLVLLLNRFCHEPDIAKSVLGLDFLEAAQDKHGALFREVGDKCLLYAGLFPERAEQRQVTLGYFVRLGRTAYNTAATQQEDALCNALCTQFVPLMDVLAATRGRTETPDLLRTLAAWEETDSQWSLRQLTDKGIIPLRSSRATN